MLVRAIINAGFPFFIIKVVEFKSDLLSKKATWDGNAIVREEVKGARDKEKLYVDEIDLAVQIAMNADATMDDKRGILYDLFGDKGRIDSLIAVRQRENHNIKNKSTLAKLLSQKASNKIFEVFFCSLFLRH